MGTEETFLVQTKGGPFAGETRVVPRGILGWPPPLTLPGVFHGGFYLLVSRSELPEQRPDSPVKRGAEYEWRLR